MQSENKQIQAFLNQLLAATVVIDTMDELVGSPLYTHGIKLRGSPWIKVVEKLLNNHAKLGDADAAAFNSLQNHFTEFITELRTLRPEHIAGLKELIKEFKNAPELVLHRNGIGILKN